MPTPRPVAAAAPTTLPAHQPGQPGNRPAPIPARAGNANARAALAQGTHPASGQRLLPAPDPDTAIPAPGCDTCALSYTRTLTAPGDTPTAKVLTGVRRKCSQAPVSRRGRQGIDLRPGTPACVLYQTAAPAPPTG
jgi:hypothetical protein